MMTMMTTANRILPHSSIHPLSRPLALSPSPLLLSILPCRVPMDGPAAGDGDDGPSPFALVPFPAAAF